MFSDLLFDCSRVLEYAKIRTILQSNANYTINFTRLTETEISHIIGRKSLPALF